jgi:hypothetical protein
MIGHMAHVRTDISEGHIASIIRVTRIGELGTLAVTSNRGTLPTFTLRLLVTANVPSSPILVTLMMEALHRFLQEAHGVTFQKTVFCSNKLNVKMFLS